MKGDPTKINDLVRTGVRTASLMICFAGFPDTDDVRMMDLKGIITSSTIENKFLEWGIDVMSVVELHNPSNVCLMRRYPKSLVPDEKHDQDLRKWDQFTEDIDSENIHYMTHPRFAAGRVLMPTNLGALFAQAYYVPGVMEIMDALIMPTGGFSKQSNMPWLLPVTSDMVGMTYSSLFQHLLSVREPAQKALLMGLLRSADTGDARLPYVVTNAPSSLRLVKSDWFYVLASPEFGKLHCTAAGATRTQIPLEDVDPFKHLSAKEKKFAGDSRTIDKSAKLAAATRRQKAGILEPQLDTLAEDENEDDTVFPVRRQAPPHLAGVLENSSIQAEIATISGNPTLNDRLTGDINKKLEREESDEEHIGPEEKLLQQKKKSFLDLWEEFTDDETGKAFWKHKKTNQTTWNDPRSAGDRAKARKRGMRFQAPPLAPKGKN